MDEEARTEQDQIADGGSNAEQEPQAEGSRRAFLRDSARKAAYAAPLVLLFRPKKAIAASPAGSKITHIPWGRMGKWA